MKNRTNSAKKNTKPSTPKDQSDSYRTDTEYPLTPFNGIVRYSDEELREFKELIQTKLAEATSDYELLRGTLSRQHDNGTEDTSPTFKLAEDSTDVFGKEEIAHLAIRRKKFIDNLKNALVRIENKTYGICRVSGKLISKERLRMVPHTTLSIDAKMDTSRMN